MKGYIRSLTDAGNADAEKAGAIQIAANDFTPLTAQIRRWINSLTESQRKRDWRITEIVQNLTGKYRSKPSAMQVAATLKADGWTQHRDCSRAGGNVRYWRHPQQ